MSGNDDNKDPTELPTEATDGDSQHPNLTSTSFLKAMVIGMPKSVVMRVVGKSGPTPTKKMPIFIAWLSNGDDFLIKLIAFGVVGDDLAIQLKLNSVVSFKNLSVRPISLYGGEKNIYTSDKQFVYDESNSRVVDVWPMAATMLQNMPDYPVNPYPPFWKYFATVKQYDQHLAGRAVVLTDFDEYTFTYYDFNKPVQRKGIYGIAGDPKFKKVFFFVDCEPTVTGLALSEFKKSYFFNYYEAKALFKGNWLWIFCSYNWTSTMDIENKKMATDDKLYTFVERCEATCSTPAKVKKEASEDDSTPAKKIFRQQF